MKPPENSPPLAARLADIRSAMAQAQTSPASAARVTLVAASKTQPEAVLEEAIALGVTEFGENKVQEAEAKWPALKARHPNLVLHLIGPLQSNKAADAVALFDVIQTIDRPKIALAVMEAIKKREACHPGLVPGSSPTTGASLSAGSRDRPGMTMPRCYVQVNTGEEPQKGGVAPQELGELLQYCRTIGLPIEGLMCIPPAEHNPAPHFALLNRLAKEHGLSGLSMGMSDDFADAIRLGATAVRIGTRLFGPRVG